MRKEDFVLFYKFLRNHLKLSEMMIRGLIRVNVFPPTEGEGTRVYGVIVLERLGLLTVVLYASS